MEFAVLAGINIESEGSVKGVMGPLGWSSIYCHMGGGKWGCTIERVVR